MVIEGLDMEALITRTTGTLRFHNPHYQEQV
jgi:hypothetical protein